MSTAAIPAAERVALLASIVDSSDDAIVAKTPNGIITSWNRGAEQVYGYSAEEVIGKPISVVTSPDRPNEMDEILARIRRGERVDHYETKRLRKDRKAIAISLTVSPIYDASHKLIGVSSIARDITERRQADEQLRSASLYARSLIEASLDPLVTINPEGRITDVNEATIKATGVERQGLIGTDFSNYFTEPEKAREGYQQVFSVGSVTDYPLTMRHREGRVIDVLYNASVYKDAGGEVLGVFAAARDVTAQKQASQYARSLIEASLDPLVTISPDGKITDVNEATIRVTGVERDRLIGTDFSDYFTEPEKAREGYQQVFSQGFVIDYPLTIRHRNGRHTSVLYNASVYKDVFGNVLGVFAAARDVTAQKRAEAEVAEQRSKELERLAELERFQKLTVGRELKMIELKKELAELKPKASPSHGDSR
jgi:PAS domain S-box-containing protein